jgi:aminoglycoside phosphotransferase family enzyme
VLERVERALAASRQALEDRVRQGQVVDGHGDLRPEHVCLADPIVIFDCLEFSRELRWSDPFDEIAFLGLECELLGAAWIGPALAQSLSERLGSRPSDDLTRFYRAFRAVMRARLTIAHLLDPVPREPAKWEPLAMRYLSIAETTLSAMAMSGC